TNTWLKINSTLFENNIGTLFDSQQSNTSWEGIPSTLACPTNTDQWDVTGVMEWERVNFISNAIGSGGNYLMRFMNHRIWMKQLQLINNNCSTDSISNTFATQCLMFIDTTFKMAQNTYISTNYGPSIIDIKRSTESLSHLSTVETCIDTNTEKNDTAIAFVYAHDVGSGDIIKITNNAIDSLRVHYGIYLEQDDTAFKNQTINAIIMDNVFKEVSTTSLFFHQTTKAENTSIQLNISHNTFETTTMIGNWYSDNQNNRRSHVDFVDNTFKNYKNNHASPFLIQLTTNGNPVTFLLNNNKWNNLQTNKWIELYGKIDTVHNNMLIEDNSEYLYCEDCNSISMEGMIFESFVHGLNIKRVNVTKTNSMSIKIHHCTFNDESLSSSLEMIRIYNIQPTDTILINASNFTQAYVNMSFGASGKKMSTQPTTANIWIDNVIFKDFTTSASLHLTDIDFSLVNNSYRPWVKIEKSSFLSMIGEIAVMDWKLIANNFNDISQPRILLVDNIFENNKVEWIIKWRSDHWSNACILGPVVQLTTNIFSENTVWNIIQMSGPDLSTYTPLLDALQNTFTSNNVSDSLINIKDASLILSSSTINNHRLIVNSQISNIQLSNIITYGSDVIYLNDTRSSTFGTKLTATNCQFTSQWSNLGVNMNVQSYDQIIWSSSNFSKITFSFESGTDTHASFAHQVYFSQCTFSYYHLQTALIINVPTYHPWLFNSSLHLCRFQHSLNHFTSKPLILLNNLNRNKNKLANISISDSFFTNNTDVIGIVEDEETTNTQNVFLTELILTSVTSQSNKGTVLYYLFNGIASHKIELYSCHWLDNVQMQENSSSLVILDTFSRNDCSLLDLDTSSTYAQHFIVTGSTFDSNNYSTAIIYAYCSVLLLKSSSLGNNQGNISSFLMTQVADVTISESLFKSNVGGTYGCVFDSSFNNSFSVYRVLSSIFETNHAVLGGALSFYYNNSIYIRPVVSIVNSSFLRNTASGYGGGAFVKIVPGVNEHVGENQSISGKVTVQISHFQWNIAPYGGGMFLQGISIDSKQSVFSGNNASVAGGGALVHNPDQCSNTSTKMNPVFYIENSNFNLNSAPFGLGGGIVSNCYVLKMVNGSVSNNTAQYRGGGIVAHSTCLQMQRLNIQSNSADFGGAIAISELRSQTDCNTFINNSTLFDSNTAIYGGGAIHILNLLINVEATKYEFLQFQVHPEAARMIDFESIQFLHNKASKYGGALAVSRHWLEYDSGNEIVLNESSTISMLVEKTLFTSNSIRETSFDETHGGGAIAWLTESLSKGQLNLMNSEFKTNDGGSQGGAIFITSFECQGSDLPYTLGACTCKDYSSNMTTRVVQSNIFGNQAQLGGGISTATGLIQIMKTNFSVHNSTFGGAMALRSAHEIYEATSENNYATEYGGAMYVGCVEDIRIKQSTFSKNKGKIGGGMYAEHASTLDIDRVKWLSNKGVVGGGAFGLGVTSDPNKQQVHFTNNRFDSNQAVFGSISYINTHQYVDLLYSSPSLPLSVNKTALTYPFDINVDSYYGGNIQRLYLILSSDTDLLFNKIYSWDDSHLQLISSNNQKIANISQYGLGYPHIVVFDIKQGALASETALQLVLNATELIAYMNMGKSQKLNVSFDLIGVVPGSTSIDQTTTLIKFANCAAVNNLALGMGGFFMDNNFGNTNLFIDKSKFSSNDGAASSVGAFWSCSADMKPKAFVRIQNTFIGNNSAIVAIAAMSSKCTQLEIENVHLDGNKCQGYAGNGHFQYSSLKMTNVIVSNSVTQLSGNMWAEHSTVAMDNCTFLNNKAVNGNGGCMYITRVADMIFEKNGNISSDDVLHLQNSKFINNQCGLGGGCLYISTDFDTIDVNVTDTSAFTKQTFSPTFSPTSPPTSPPTFSPTSPPSISSRRLVETIDGEPCNIQLLITGDTFHTGDISWKLTGNNGTSHTGNYANSTCISTNETCLQFTIKDSFGDGLGYGDGTWSIVWNNHTFISPSHGDYGPSETIEICNPKSWKNVYKSITMGATIHDSSGSNLLLDMKNQLFKLMDNRLVVDITFSNVFSMYPKTNNTECIRSGRYCYPERLGGSDILKHMLAVLCLWADPSLSSTLNWQYFWNDTNDTTILNNALDIISRCPLVQGNLNSNSTIDALNVSLSFNKVFEGQSLPLVVASNQAYHVADVNDEFTNWNSNSSYCNILHQSELVPFVCKAFDGTYAPVICQSSICQDWGYDESYIKLKFYNVTSAELIPSEPFELGTKYYAFHKVPMKILILDQGCNYTNTDSDLTKVVTFLRLPSTCNWVKLVESFYHFGARAIVFSNSDVHNTTKSSSSVQRIDINATMNNINQSAFASLESKISSSLNELLSGKTQRFVYRIVSNKTITFITTVEVNDTKTPYENLEQSVFTTMLSNAVLYQLQSSSEGSYSMTFNSLVHYTQIPTQAPTISPTQQPTPAVVHVNIPIRVATKIPHNFVIKTGANYTIDMVKDKQPTTPLPTTVPTVAAPTASNTNPTSKKKEVGFQLYRSEFDQPFKLFGLNHVNSSQQDTIQRFWNLCNITQYSPRSANLHLGMDTVFETLNSFCLFYEDYILIPLNQTNISVTSTNQEHWISFAPSSSTKCSKAVSLTIQNLTKGSYCLAVQRKTSTKPYKVLIKRLYNWIAPNVQIDNCVFQENKAGKNGGAMNIQGKWNMENYLSVGVFNTSFDYNSGGEYGGAFGGYFGVSSSLSDLPFIGAVDFNKVTMTNNSAKYGAGVSMALNSQVQTTFKSVIRFTDSLLYGNNASIHGGGAYVNWGNLQLVRTVLSKNIAEQDGGGVWMQNAVFSSSQVLFQGNVAGSYGGGHYRELSQVAPYQMCMGFYYTNLTKNIASRGGAFYWKLYGKTSDHEADCTLFLNASNHDNNASVAAPDGFFEIVQGDNPITDPNSLLSGFCKSSSSCATFSSSVKYLCVQTTTVDFSGPCEKASLNTSIDKSKLYKPILYFNMTPGSYKLMQVFGWDAFGNPLKSVKYTVKLERVPPVTVTTTAPGRENLSWVFPMLVDAGSVGKTGNASVVDPNGVAITQIVKVTVINCFPGYYQKIQQNLGEGIFTCQACGLGEYTLKTNPCKECPLGCKCEGYNFVTVKLNWYAIANDNGYLATQICPAGYCCNNTNGCNFLNTSYLCATGRNSSVPLCGRCTEGLSETTSPSGDCAICTDNSGLTKQILLAVFLGIAMIGLFFRSGWREAQKAPMPIETYLTKSALFVFQLIPFLTFQQTSKIIEPLARAANFRMDFFSSSSSGECVLKNMSGRQKLSLDLLPSLVLFVELLIVYVGMMSYKYIKLNGRPLPVRWENGFNSAIWNVFITLYAQIASALIKLTNCRPVSGYGVRMYYVGHVECYDKWHFIAYAALFVIVTVPIFLYFVMLREYRVGGHLYLKIRYPSLVLMFRKNTWWHVSYGLLRRFAIVFVSSLPFSSTEVTSTVLAIIVGLIVAIQLFVNPMAHHSTNIGEAYVWFIALAITLFNIKLEAPSAFHLIEAILALGPFFLTPYFIYLLLLDKLPYIPTLEGQTSTDLIDEDNTLSEDIGTPRESNKSPKGTKSPKETLQSESTIPHKRIVRKHTKTGLMIDNDGSKKVTIPLINVQLTLLKKAPPPEGALPPGGVFTDTVKMAETVRDDFLKKHAMIRRLQSNESNKQQRKRSKQDSGDIGKMPIMSNDTTERKIDGELIGNGAAPAEDDRLMSELLSDDQAFAQGTDQTGNQKAFDKVASDTNLEDLAQEVISSDQKENTTGNNLINNPSNVSNPNDNVTFRGNIEDLVDEMLLGADKDENNENLTVRSNNLEDLVDELMNDEDEDEGKGENQILKNDQDEKKTLISNEVVTQTMRSNMDDVVGEIIDELIDESEESRSKN
ncbi:adhesin-like protein, partial [Reticulomyxa filosa]